jgi:hypothetical protein
MPGEKVHIGIRDPTGRVSECEAKWDTEMKKILSDFCNHAGVPYESVEFFLEGAPIPGDAKVGELEGVSDGTIIDCFPGQKAGGGGGIWMLWPN